MESTHAGTGDKCEEEEAAEQKGYELFRRPKGVVVHMKRYCTECGLIQSCFSLSALNLSFIQCKCLSSRNLQLRWLP